MNELKSAIRVGVAAAVAALMGWLSQHLPIEIPNQEVLNSSLTELVFTVVVYYVARMGEKWFNVPFLLVKKPEDVK